MGKINDKQELINFLLDYLPDLSNYINQIVYTIPKNIEDVNLEHIQTIKPHVQNLLNFIKENTNKAKPSTTMNADDELRNIYDLYIKAISDVLEGVESLYIFLNHEEGEAEENIEFFIEKLFEGSIGIAKLVEKITG